MRFSILVKVAAPIAVMAALAFHSFGAAFAAEPVTISNRSEGLGACSSTPAGAACATLFDGSAVLWPGKAPEQARVTIGYHAAGPSSEFGLYLPRFESRSARSNPACTAPDPASKLNLTISQGAATIYEGNLAAFAAQHHDPQTVLHLRGGHNGNGALDRWAGGDSSVFTIAVGLDVSADNPYMGCVTATDIAWFAA